MTLTTFIQSESLTSKLVNRNSTWLVYILVAVIASACGGAPRVQSSSSQTLNLSGTWQLDRHESDDVRSRLMPLFAKQEKRFRRIDRAVEHAESSALPPDVVIQDDPKDQIGRPIPELSTAYWMRQQRQHEMRAIESLVSPANQLTITLTAQRMHVATDKGEGSRDLTPGEVTSLFTAFGGFDVASGWNKSSYVINSRGTGDNGIRLSERYTLLDNDKLEEVLQANLPALGKQTFRFTYKRVSP